MRLGSLSHTPWPIAIGLLLSLVGLVSAEQQQAGEPIPPRWTAFEWIAIPDSEWQPYEEAEVGGPNGLQWQIRLETRLIGRMESEELEVEVTLPRMTIRRLDGIGITPGSIVVPSDNQTLAFYSEEDSVIDAVPMELVEEDGIRWPNPCQFSLLDETGRLDVDQDGSPEVAIRSFCSCPLTGCNRIELIELDPSGANRIDPQALVTDVSLQKVALVEILPDADPRRPRLRIEPAYLEDCRFISAIGIRGEIDCPSCCRIGVLLRPEEGGTYRTTYDRSFHSKLLQRAKDDLQYVAAGNPEIPLESYEEAQIARAASFFYLTGTGRETQGVVLEGLGPRSRDHEVIQLLTRLDRFFLKDRRH